MAASQAAVLALSSAATCRPLASSVSRAWGALGPASVRDMETWNMSRGIHPFLHSASALHRNISITSRNNVQSSPCILQEGPHPGGPVHTTATVGQGLRIGSSANAVGFRWIGSTLSRGMARSRGSKAPAKKKKGGKPDDGALALSEKDVRIIDKTGTIQKEIAYEKRKKELKVKKKRQKVEALKKKATSNALSFLGGVGLQGDNWSQFDRGGWAEGGHEWYGGELGQSEMRFNKKQTKIVGARGRVIEDARSYKERQQAERAERLGRRGGRFGGGGGGSSWTQSGEWREGGMGGGGARLYGEQRVGRRGMEGEREEVWERGRKGGAIVSGRRGSWDEGIREGSRSWPREQELQDDWQEFQEVKKRYPEFDGIGDGREGFSGSRRGRLEDDEFRRDDRGRWDDRDNQLRGRRREDEWDESVSKRGGRGIDYGRGVKGEEWGTSGGYEGERKGMVLSDRGRESYREGRDNREEGRDRSIIGSVGGAENVRRVENRRGHAELDGSEEGRTRGSDRTERRREAEEAKSEKKAKHKWQPIWPLDHAAAWEGELKKAVEARERGSAEGGMEEELAATDAPEEGVERGLLPEWGVLDGGRVRREWGRGSGGEERRKAEVVGEEGDGQVDGSWGINVLGRGQRAERERWREARSGMLGESSMEELRLGTAEGIFDDAEDDSWKGASMGDGKPLVRERVSLKATMESSQSGISLQKETFIGEQKEEALGREVSPSLEEKEEAEFWEEVGDGERGASEELLSSIWDASEPLLAGSTFGSEASGSGNGSSEEVPLDHKGEEGEGVSDMRKEVETNLGYARGRTQSSFASTSSGIDEVKRDKGLLVEPLGSAGRGRGSGGVVGMQTRARDSFPAFSKWESLGEGGLGQPVEGGGLEAVDVQRGSGRGKALQQSNEGAMGNAGAGRGAGKMVGFEGNPEGFKEWYAERSKASAMAAGNSSGSGLGRERRRENTGGRRLEEGGEHRERYREGSNEDDSSDRFQSDAHSSWVQGEVVYGVAPVQAALQAGRRKCFSLYVQEGVEENLGPKGKRKDKAGVMWILREAERKGVRTIRTGKHELNLLTGNRPHQGLVLDASPLELEILDTLPDVSDLTGKSDVWVALDEVVDPMNFGAILRSAHFLGAGGVVVCAKNSAPLSAVVAKASAGAMEVMKIHSCRNMVRFLERCTSAGWLVAGASAEASAVPITRLPRGIPTLLVLGNEGVGLRTTVRRACTHMVSIRAGGAVWEESSQSEGDERGEGEGEGEERSEAQDLTDGEEWKGGSGPAVVDSLNVSVATGILLHELLVRQKDLPTVYMKGGFNEGRERESVDLGELKEKAAAMGEGGGAGDGGESEAVSMWKESGAMDSRGRGSEGGAPFEGVNEEDAIQLKATTGTEGGR